MYVLVSFGSLWPVRSLNEEEGLIFIHFYLQKDGKEKFHLRSQSISGFFLNMQSVLFLFPVASMTITCMYDLLYKLGDGVIHRHLEASGTANRIFPIMYPRGQGTRGYQPFNSVLFRNC